MNENIAIDDHLEKIMTEILPGFLCLNINGLMNIVFFFLSGRDTGQIGCTAGLCQGDALANKQRFTGNMRYKFVFHFRDVDL